MRQIYERLFLDNDAVSIPISAPSYGILHTFCLLEEVGASDEYAGEITHIILLPCGFSFDNRTEIEGSCGQKIMLTLLILTIYKRFSFFKEKRLSLRRAMSFCDTKVNLTALQGVFCKGLQVLMAVQQRVFGSCREDMHMKGVRIVE